MTKIPSITLDARDVAVPPTLKALAAKVRVHSPTYAALLDRRADEFAAWKRANPSVR